MVHSLLKKTAYSGYRKVGSYNLPAVYRFSCTLGCSAGDGVFTTSKDGYITLVDLKSNSTRNLVALSDLKDVRLNRYCSVCLLICVGTRSSPVSFDLEIVCRYEVHAYSSGPRQGNYFESSELA